MSEAPKAFTGRRRNKKTHWSVRFGDVAAKMLIMIGGIGTIAAVSLVGLFLLYETLPLFLPAEVGEPTTVEAAWEGDQPVQLQTDEYGVMGWMMQRDGTLHVFRLATGELIQTLELFKPDAEQPRATAVSFNPGGQEVAVGFSDGTVRLGSVHFETSYFDPGDTKAGVTLPAPGEAVPYGTGILELTPTGQYRLQELTYTFSDPVRVAPDGAGELAAVRLIDMKQTPTGSGFAAMTEGGHLVVSSIRERRNMMTGKTVQTARSGEVPYQAEAGIAPPDFLLLGGLGDAVYLAWKDGRALRFNASDVSDIKLAEADIDLVDLEGESLTVLQWMIGGSTIVAGDTAGRVGTWFLTNPPEARGTDGRELARAHLMDKGSPVTAIGVSSITRLIATGHANGMVRLFFVTSEKRLAEVQTAPEGESKPVRLVTIAPKEDAFLAATDNALVSWGFDPGHPETSVKALFGQVWYEGYNRPQFVWQSTGGTDSFEPKLGLIPLIFGTLKATIYAMIFGTPLALLAAIYTSEFLQPRLKAKLKPTIELMASLPSVVLGFLAGLVIAPFVEDFVPATLMMFVTVPMTLLLGAYVWQSLPIRLQLRMQSLRLLAMLVTLPAGVAVAVVVGPVLETIAFGGNLKLWLSDASFGSGAGGWLLLLVPLSALVVSFFFARVVNPRLRAASIGGRWSRKRFAAVDFGKFIFGMVATLGLSAVVALLLAEGLGWDPRGSIVDTYVQRNAMIVGFAMGFAIIPIIYTIAEDALSSVPEHLRSASLGAGATPWQTATRIIIPAAMSGLFSACMIGLGRAVGETMIVLMAAGNTPIMDINIFNGFRTLSANIATELPEAVKGSTHYRTLFLAALVLFIMTFVLNTAAESVRIRFRKRSAQL